MHEFSNPGAMVREINKLSPYNHQAPKVSSQFLEGLQGITLAHLFSGNIELGMGVFALFTQCSGEAQMNAAIQEQLAKALGPMMGVPNVAPTQDQVLVPDGYKLVKIKPNGVKSAP